LHRKHLENCRKEIIITMMQKRKEGKKKKILRAMHTPLSY